MFSEVNSMYGQLNNLTVWLYSVTCLLGLMFGLLMHFGKFCLMGAINDALVLKRFNRLLTVLVTTSLLGFGMHYGMQFWPNWIIVTHLSYASMQFNWLTYGLGGLLFGFGMVMASGCPMQQILLAGKGNVKNMVNCLWIVLAAQLTMTGMLEPIQSWLNNHTPSSTFSMLEPTQGMYFNSFLLMVSILLMPILFKTNKNFHTQRINTKFKQVIASLLTALIASTLLLALNDIMGNQAYQAMHPQTLQEYYIGQSHETASIGTVSSIMPLTQLLQSLLFKQSFGLMSMFLLGIFLAGFCFYIQKLFKQLNNSSNNHISKPIIQNNTWQLTLGSICMGIGGVWSMGCITAQFFNVLWAGYAAVVYLFVMYVLGVKLAHRFI